MLSTQAPVPSQVSRASQRLLASSVAVTQLVPSGARFTVHVLSVPVQVSAGLQVPAASAQVVPEVATRSTHAPAPSQRSRASQGLFVSSVGLVHAVTAEA